MKGKTVSSLYYVTRIYLPYFKITYVTIIYYLFVNNIPFFNNHSGQYGQVHLSMCLHLFQVVEAAAMDSRQGRIIRHFLFLPYVHTSGGAGHHDSGNDSSDHWKVAAGEMGTALQSIAQVAAQVGNGDVGNVRFGAIGAAVIFQMLYDPFIRFREASWISPALNAFHDIGARHFCYVIDTGAMVMYL